MLFLDEPTTGLDPQARLFVWDRIRELRARGVTMVLTTHDMDEAAQLSDRVGIIDHGKLLALDTPAALTRGLTGQSVLELTVVPVTGDDPEALLAALGTVEGVERGERVAAAVGAIPPGFGGPGGGGPGGGRPGGFAAFAGGAPPGRPNGGRGPDGELRLRLYLDRDPALLLAPVVAALATRSATLRDVHIGAPSLEDVFINLTGRGLR